MIIQKEGYISPEVPLKRGLEIDIFNSCAIWGTQTYSLRILSFAPRSLGSLTIYSFPNRNKALSVPLEGIRFKGKLAQLGI
jgi:hypothetical protein